MGKSYESVNMVVKSDHGGDVLARQIFEGITQDGSTWIFPFPDTIFEKHASVSFVPHSSVDSIENMLGFKLVVTSDTLFSGECGLPTEGADIYLSYLYTDTHVNIPLYNVESKSYVLTTVYQDQYLVQANSDQCILSAVEALGFKYCRFPKGTNVLYRQQLESYTQLTQKYPDGRYLLYTLKSNILTFNSKSDIAVVFNSFSEELKHSYFGQQIAEFIDNKDTMYKYRDSSIRVFLP